MFRRTWGDFNVYKKKVYISINIYALCLHLFQVFFYEKIPTCQSNLTHRLYNLWPFWKINTFIFVCLSLFIWFFKLQLNYILLLRPCHFLLLVWQQILHCCQFYWWLRKHNNRFTHKSFVKFSTVSLNSINTDRFAVHPPNISMAKY